jgi:putative hydrolase of the HAD superfamily
MTYRAVFFDAGETLVHAHPSFPELLAQVLSGEGHPVDAETVRDRIHLVGHLFSEASRAGRLWSTSPEDSRAFWGSVYRVLLAELGVPFTDRIADTLYQVFTDVSSYRAFPDALPVLEWLESAGVRMGVISNFEEWLERLLESVGLSRFFDVRVISGVEGLEKPDPKIFRLALDRLGVRAEDSAYVGDSVEFDVEPADAVGMLGILLDRRDRYPEHPGPRIASLEDLPEAIGLEARV